MKNIEPTSSNPTLLNEKVLEVIEKEINPKLFEHQGWIELKEIVDQKVYIRFRGACHACQAIYSTLESEVKPPLLKAIDEISDVVIAEEVSEEMINYARSLFTAPQK